MEIIENAVMFSQVFALVSFSNGKTVLPNLISQIVLKRGGFQLGRLIC